MIIVPKKNLYLSERRWGRPQFQRGIIIATAAYQQAAAEVKKLDTTITSALRKVGTTTPSKTPKDIDAIGFDAGSDFYTYAAGFGSIASATYTDAGSNSRLIDSIYWIGGQSDGVFMVLDTVSIPNTDTTFSKIVLGGTTFLRSAAVYTASVDGGTGWEWAAATNPIPVASNPNSCEVWVI